MRKREENRVVGPYKERAGWRVVVVENGRRENHFVQNESEAVKLAAKLRRGLARKKPLRIRELMHTWASEKVSSGQCLPTSQHHQSGRLAAFLAPCVDDAPHEITEAVARKLYERYIASPGGRGGLPAAATHRTVLKTARSFFAWVVRRGHARSNPFAAVAPVGRPRRGKPQLRIDEARAFLAAALAQADARGDGLAVGAAAALLLGLRVSEIVCCRVRDLDSHGLLWIEGTKTEAARRRLAVPGILQPYLLRLAESRKPQDFLFGESRPGKHWSRMALWKRVQQLCDCAQVPVVCPHSLRGLFATLAVASGAVSHAVAAALGHSSFAVTAAHYAQESAIDGARTAAALSALGIGREDEKPN